MSDLQVQAELTLKDNMTKPAAKGLEEIAKSADKLQQSGRRGADGRFLKQMATDGADAARSMDAVGREAHELQQHIKGAERSGTALRRTLAGVRDAGRDASKYMSQMGKGLAAAGRNAQAAGGGVMAAGYVAKKAIEKPVSFETRSLEAANTIYGNIDPKDRIAKAGELRAQAYTATRKYGGTSEQAMEIIQGLGAGGTSGEDIEKLLPVALKTVVAGKLDAKDVTTLMVKGIKNKMFTVDTASLAMDEGLMAGKLGSFEYKDAAHWIPQFAATGMGMKSHEGYQMHLANSQAIETVSANPDQAGNNYLNLLAKMSAPEVKKNFKDKGINLEKIQLQAAAKGIDPVTATADAIETIMAKNKKYQKLKKTMEAAANDEEKRQIASQMADIIEGGVLGKLIPDRQAMIGLIGVTSQKAYRDDVLKKMENAKGTVDQDHTVIASGTDYKMQQVANERDAAMSATLDTIKTPLDATLDRATRFAQDNPTLATATAGTAILGGMATAGGAAWGGMKLLQGAKPAIAGTAATGAKNAGTAIKFMSKAAVPLAVAGTACDIVSTENNETLTRAQKNVQHSGAAGGIVGGLAGAKGGAMAGAAFGAMIGSFAPVIGNAIGAAVGGFLGGVGGGILGYWGGSEGGRAVGEMAFSPESAPQPAPVVTVNANVTIDGQQVAGIVKQTIEYEQNRESLRQ